MATNTTNAGSSAETNRCAEYAAKIVDFVIEELTRKPRLDKCAIPMGDIERHLQDCVHCHLAYETLRDSLIELKYENSEP